MYGTSAPKTDAEWLYDVLDRLAHSLIEQQLKPPEHQWSPLGSALAMLHDKKQYACERAWCADNTIRPNP